MNAYRFVSFKFKNNLQWIVIFGILLVNLLIAAVIRTQTLTQLEERYYLGIDAYRFVRRADYIIENGRLPAREATTWAPVGRDLTVTTNLWPYVLAYIYRFSALLFPHIQQHTVMALSPVVFYLLALILAFLLASKLFNPFVGLMTSFTLSIFPSEMLLLRSMAGFSDRDSFTLFLLLLTFYFYVLSTGSLKWRWKVAWRASSGVVMGLLGLTWEGVGLFISVIVLVDLLKFMLADEFHWRDFVLFSCWVLPIVLFLEVGAHAYHNLMQPFVFLAVGPIVLLLGLFILYFTIRRSILLTERLTLQNRIPLSISLLLVYCFFLLSLVIGCFITSDAMKQGLLGVLDNFLSPFGSSRYMTFIGELTPPSLNEWYISYGLYFFVFALGSLLMLKELLASFSTNPSWIIASFEIMLATTFYFQLLSRYINEMVAQVLYGASLVCFTVVILISIVKKYKKKATGEALPLAGAKEGKWMLLAWFIVTLSATKGAFRFDFFFAPVAIILASYAIVQILRWFLGTESRDIISGIFIILLSWQGFAIKKESSYLLICIVLSIALVVMIFRRLRQQQPSLLIQRFIFCLFFLAFLVGLTNLAPAWGGWSKRAYAQSKTIQPLGDIDLKKAFNWMRTNLPPDTVLAAHWNYGSRINWLANLKTIVDEDTYSQYWLYLTARHLFDAQSEVEALEFLKTHQATHLMITRWNFEALSQISFMASDQHFDRHSSMIPFRQTQVQQNKEGKILITMHPTHLVRDKFKNSSHSSEEIKAVEFSFTPSMEQFSVAMRVNSGNREVRRYPGTLWFQGRAYHLGEGGVPGVFALLPGPGDGTWNGFYLPELLANSLTARLYFLGVQSDYFKLVYPRQKLRKIPPVKIWEIRYPESITVNRDYLELEFQDSALYQSWRRVK